MKLYDIQGNEIHGKEVVFERYVNGFANELTQPRIDPFYFERIICLGASFGYTYFSCYDEIDPNVPMLYLGQLKDK